eukprot:2434994-Rhodomonas_salina.2
MQKHCAGSLSRRARVGWRLPARGCTLPRNCTADPASPHTATACIAHTRIDVATDSTEAPTRFLFGLLSLILGMRRIAFCL